MQNLLSKEDKKKSGIHGLLTAKPLYTDRVHQWYEKRYHFVICQDGQVLSISANADYCFVYTYQHLREEKYFYFSKKDWLKIS